MHRFNLQSGRLFKGPIEDLLPSQPCNVLGAERLPQAHALWQGAPDGPDKADWNSIAEQVTAGSPPCREWVQDLLTYVKGTDPAASSLREDFRPTQLHEPCGRVSFLRKKEDQQSPWEAPLPEGRPLEGEICQEW